jgi:hypothetical protein
LIRLLRSLVGLALLAGLVWASFAVKLGRRTLAEHVDRIGETPEARELLEGTRGKVTPLVEDATDRMLGEHIEAPTAPHARATPAKPKATPPRAGTRRPAAPTATAIAAPP